jgi:hypothetical protein
MRKVGMIYSYAGAALVAALASVSSIGADVMASTGPAAPTFDAPKRRRSGDRYPHSSKRQNDRIARQLAAGQISFIKHGLRV